MCKNNKMKSVLFCGLFVWSLIVSTVSTQEIALDYQDECNPTNPATDLCDKKKHLTCTKITEDATTGYCDCAVIIEDGKDVALFYLREKSTCVSPAGEPCRDRFFDGKYVLECSRNAYCVQSNYNESGYCDCYEPYVPQESGNCIVSHEGPCNNAQDCDIYAHLTCLENTCVCGHKSVWEGSACNGLVGGTCEEGGQRPKVCVVNADCVSPTNSSSHCSCTTGYQESTSDNRCYKQFNQTCTIPTDETAPRECHENFECSKLTEDETETPRCRCAANYDISEDQTKCLGRSGATCDKANPERSSCIDFAACTNTTENPEDPHICLCDPGYAETNDKLCLANYGTTCIVNATSPSQSQCHTELKLECAAEETPVCRCMANHDYDATRGVCLGHEGQSCSAGAECVSNYCNMLNETSGTCGCPSGSTASPDKTKCWYPYDAACTNENDPAVCNPTLSLRCGDNGTCTCLNDVEFVREETKDGCSVKAGESCSDAGRTCVEQSKCEPDGSGNTICQCIPGYAGRFDGTCAVRGSAGKAAAGSFLSFALVLVVTLIQ